jgi:pyruvate/2-oxoglutarate/acetoin dehydrogenase E1 component
LLLAAIADNNPVLVFEHRWLMKKAGIVPETPYMVPLGRAVCRRRGTDLTVVGASHAIELAERAAAEVSSLGIDVEVIDIRTVKPLDRDTILESVRRTGRLLAVDTGWAMGGVCAELACMVAERAFEALRAPVRRVGLPDVPTPAGRTLEGYYYPDVDRMASAMIELARYSR